MFQGTQLPTTLPVLSEVVEKGYGKSQSNLDVCAMAFNFQFWGAVKDVERLYQPIKVLGRTNNDLNLTLDAVGQVPSLSLAPAIDA